MGIFSGFRSSSEPAATTTAAPTAAPQTSSSPIESLYQSELGRASDPGGLAYWTNAYNSGASLSDIQNAFRGSQEYQARAAAPAPQNVAYDNFPNQVIGSGTGVAAPVSGGLTAASAPVSSGLTAAATPTSISDMYQTYLGRAPEAEGLNYWNNALSSGSMTADQIANAIKTSAEGQAYSAPKTVTDLYQTYLGRAPEAEGLNYWTNALSSGQMTADQVANAIKTSNEGDIYNAPKTVSELYQTYLGRTPDQAGQDYWSKQITGGLMSPEQVAAAIRGSDEGAIRNDISGLYQKYLGREADPEGLQYWADKINKGEMSWDQLASNIIGSEEGTKYTQAHPVQYFGDIYARDSNGNLIANTGTDEFGNAYDAGGYQKGNYGFDTSWHEGDNWDQYQARLNNNYSNAVSSMYKGILGRDASQEELNSIAQNYGGGRWQDIDLQQVQKDLLYSAEGQKNVGKTGTWVTVTKDETVKKNLGWGEYETTEPVTKAIYVPPSVAGLPDAMREVYRSDNPQQLIDSIKNDPAAWMKQQLTNYAGTAGWLSKTAGVTNDLWKTASDLGYGGDTNAFIADRSKATNDAAKWLLDNKVMTQDQIGKLWTDTFNTQATNAQHTVLDQIHPDDGGWMGLGRVGDQVGDFLEKYQVPIMTAILGGAVLAPAAIGAAGLTAGSAGAIATQAGISGLTQTAVALASGAPTNKALIAGGLAAAGAGMGGALGPSGLNVAGSLVEQGMNPILANVAVGALSGAGLGALSGAASGNVGAGVLGGALAGGTSAGVNAATNVFGGMTGTLARLAAGTAVGVLTGKDISSALQGAAVGTVVGLAGSATKAAIDAAKSGKTDISVEGKITPNAETVDAMRKAAAEELNTLTNNSNPDSVKQYVASLPDEYFTKAISAVDTEVANSIKLAASYPTEAVTELYKQDLGREPDAEGLKYWSDQLRSGNMTLAEIQSSISGAAEGELRAEASNTTNLEKFASTLGDLIGSDETKNLLSGGVNVAGGAGAVAAPWGAKTMIDAGAAPLIKQFPQLAGAVDTVGTLAAAIVSRNPIDMLFHSSELNADEVGYDPRQGTATIDEPLVTAKEIDASSTALKDYLAQQRALYPQQITQEMQIVQKQLAILDEFKAEYPQLYSQLNTEKVINPTMPGIYGPDVINPADVNATDQGGKVVNTADVSPTGTNVGTDVVNTGDKAPVISGTDVVNPSTDRPISTGKDVVGTPDRPITDTTESAPLIDANTDVGTAVVARPADLAAEIDRVTEQAGVRVQSGALSDAMIEALTKARTDALTNVNITDLTTSLIKELDKATPIDKTTTTDLTKTQITNIVDKVITDITTPVTPVDVPVTPTEPNRPVEPPVKPPVKPVVEPKVPTPPLPTPSIPTLPTLPKATGSGTGGVLQHFIPNLTADIVGGTGVFEPTKAAAAQTYTIPQLASILDLFAPVTTKRGFADGGLVAVDNHQPEFYSEGGLNNRYVTGNGDGTSDDVPAMLANGEFVIPADVVSALGNGSNDSGAAVLDEFLSTIRAHKQKHDPKELPPDSLGALAYLNKATKKAGK